MATVLKAVIATAAAFKQYKRHFYIRKRQVFLEPLISIGHKLLLNYKKAITVLSKVLSKQTWKETLIILNINTEVNIIN